MMAERQVIEGTWEDIARHADEFAATGKRLTLIVPPDDEDEKEKNQEMQPFGRVYFGMFKGAIEAMEENLKEAEFHGDPDDELDWDE